MNTDTTIPASPSFATACLEILFLRNDVQPALGRDLMPAFGHQHRHFRLDAARDRHHLVGRGHLKVELDVRELAQPAHILVLDMAAVFAQVHRDAVRAAQVRLHRGPDRVGLVGAPRLPDGGDVVDVDAKLDHRSCSSESTVRVMQRLAAEALGDQRAHQTPRFFARPGIVVVVRRHVEQCPAADHPVAVGRAGFRPARARLRRRNASPPSICAPFAASRSSTGAYPSSASILRSKPRRIADCAARRESTAVSQARKRLAVRIEQRFVRIIARQQAQQQLVEVEAAHQADAREGRLRRRPIPPTSACPAPRTRTRSCAADETRAARRASSSAAGARRAPAAPMRPNRRVNASTMRLVSLYG